jgi:hypothetical protein
MDAMLDETIDRMMSAQHEFAIDPIIAAFITEFSKNSGGWNFVIDFFTYIKGMDCGGNYTTVYLQLRNIGDGEFITELAREICV